MRDYKRLATNPHVNEHHTFSSVPRELIWFCGLLTSLALVCWCVFGVPSSRPATSVISTEDVVKQTNIQLGQNIKLLTDEMERRANGGR